MYVHRPPQTLTPAPLSPLDLADLQAKLQQAIPSQPYYRPIPPTSSSSTIPPHSNGPLPPPAPASSWNSPPVMTGRDQNLGGGFGFGNAFNNGGGSPSSRQPGAFGTGTSPLRQGGWGGFGQNGAGGSGSGSGSGGQWQNQPKSQNGNGAGGVPSPKALPANGGRRLRSHGAVEEDGERPYHNNVLPVKAGPKDTGGFDQDAFRPLWAGRGGSGGNGNGQGRDEGADGGGGDWGGFTGERL